MSGRPPSWSAADSRIGRPPGTASPAGPPGRAPPAPSACRRRRLRTDGPAATLRQNDPTLNVGTLSATSTTAAASSADSNRGTMLLLCRSLPTIKVSSISRRCAAANSMSVYLYWPPRIERRDRHCLSHGRRRHFLRSRRRGCRPHDLRMDRRLHRSDADRLRTTPSTERATA